MLIARVADHCFWFGRYLERVESLARTLAVTRTLVMEEFQTWWPVVVVTGEKERFVEMVGKEAADDGDQVQDYMVWHPQNPSSLVASIRALRSAAQAIRDALSVDVWESLNAFYWWIESEDSAHAYGDDRHDFYVSVRREMALLNGLLASSMLEDEAQDFVKLGSSMERAGQTARLLNVHHHAIKRSTPNVVLENALWLALLRACAGVQPFMRSHRGWVEGSAVARFLALEPRFPRSIEHALVAAETSLARIVTRTESEVSGSWAHESASLARVGALRTYLSRSVPPALDQVDLHEILSQIVDDVHLACEQIGIDFLGYPQPAAKVQV